MKALVRPSLNPCPRQKLREYRLYIPGMFDSVVVGFGLSAEKSGFNPSRQLLSTDTRVETLHDVVSFAQGRPKYPQLSRWHATPSIHPSHSRSPGISQEVPPRSHGRLVLPFEICLKPCKAPVFLLV